MSSLNSIQQQLAARRAKIEAARRPEQPLVPEPVPHSSQPQLQSQPAHNQPSLTDREFALQLQEQLNNSMDVDTESNQLRTPLNATENTNFDRDIALQLQRQIDSEENNSHQRLPPQRRQPRSNDNNAFSTSFSFAGPDGIRGTMEMSEFQPFFSGMQNGGQSANPFDDPFFRQRSMPGAFESPFFMQNQFNIMMNNFNGASNFPTGFPDLAALLQSRHQRPVATQSNIDNNTVTETFHARNKTDQSKCQIVDLTDEEQKEKETKGQGSDGQTCAICMEPFKEGDKLRRLPCLHVFHAPEIDRWLKTGNDRCPICRVPISDPEQQ